MINPNDQLLQQAVQHHTAGQLPEAEKLYRQVLQNTPDHPVALNLLGALAMQSGNVEAAIDLMSKATVVSPEYGDAHSNLGLALQARGRLEEARDSFEKVLSLNPEQAEAHGNLGSVLQGLGLLDEAVECYRRALQLKPEFLKALNNLGLALKELGDLEEAQQSIERALALQPNFPEAQNNLGNILKDQGKLQAAEADYQKALDLAPGFADAHNNLGLVLHDQGRLQDAIDRFQLAVQLKPDYAEAFNNLGNALQGGRKVEEAIQCYNKALKIKPDFGDAYNNLGNAYKELGRLGDSISAYRKALEIDFEDAAASVNLLHQLRHACDWDEIPELEGRVWRQTEKSLATGRDIALRPFDYVTSSDDAQKNLAVARAKSTGIALKMSGLGMRFPINDRIGKEGKITLGYLSSDYQNHATAHLMLSLFGLHDRSAFNVFTFSHGHDDGSAYRRKIVEDSDRFFDLETLNHVDAAKTIYDAGVDILIDLKGHTGNNRLEICALRPAPVQVSYLGFPGSSGADFLDYFITDQIVTPKDHADAFSEKLVTMPHSYQINDDEQPIAEKPMTRAEFGLPEEGFVFCSFNGNFKIEPVMFDVWMALLEVTPGSVLWCYRSNDVSESNLRHEARNRGVDPDRLVFAETRPKDEHLARYRLADLALDTRVCGGHTTTSDALWAGLPVVTMLGNHFASRVSASLLTAVGLPELITENLDDYQALVLRLVQNPDELSMLKNRLEKNRLTEPLFDTPRFVRHLEKGYHRMWEIYLSGESPDNIDVAED